MYCSKCGSEVQDKTNYCPYCAYAVSDVAKLAMQKYSKKNRTSVIAGIIAGIAVIGFAGACKVTKHANKARVEASNVEESNTVVTADLEEVINAYERFYNDNKGNYYGRVGIDLIYIDDDKIPELAMQSDGIRPQPTDIFKYESGEVVYVGTINNYCCYAPKSGLIYDSIAYSTQLNGGGVCLYKLEGTTLTTVAEGSYTADGTYIWRGENVTKSQYEKRYAKVAKTKKYTYIEVRGGSSSIQEAYEKLDD